MSLNYANSQSKLNIHIPDCVIFNQTFDLNCDDSLKLRYYEPG